MKPKMRKFLVMAGALSLVACGGEPSESDLNRAVKAYFDHTNLHMRQIGGDEFMVEAPQVRKIACKADGKDAYLCDIEVSDKSGKHAAPSRFVKVSNGWKLDCEACDRMEAILGPLR